MQSSTIPRSLTTCVRGYVARICDSIQWRGNPRSHAVREAGFSLIFDARQVAVVAQTFWMCLFPFMTAWRRSVRSARAGQGRRVFKLHFPDQQRIAERRRFVPRCAGPHDNHRLCLRRKRCTLVRRRRRWGMAICARVSACAHGRALPTNAPFVNYH